MCTIRTYPISNTYKYICIGICVYWHLRSIKNTSLHCGFTKKIKSRNIYLFVTKLVVWPDRSVCTTLLQQQQQHTRAIVPRVCVCLSVYLALYTSSCYRVSNWAKNHSSSSLHNRRKAKSVKKFFVISQKMVAWLKVPSSETVLRFW